MQTCKTLVLMLALAVIVGCNRGNVSDENSKKSGSKDMAEQITKLQVDAFGLAMRVSELESGEATVSTIEPGYGVAKTKFGSFTVTVKSATNYLDGYKLRLVIGNLTTATFNGAELSISLGASI